MTTAQDPTLFIGSSSEGLPVAENLQLVLDEYCEATVWNQGVFGLSETGIGSLQKAARSYDFAVLVLTADDLLRRRENVRPVARDNVLFETQGSLPLAEEKELLEQELASLSTSAEAQGWTVKTHSDSAYRLVAPDGLRFSLTLGDARRTRRDLRSYARELNEYGLRLSRALLTPVGDSVAKQPNTRANEKQDLR
jgi:hypothetical protein